MKEKPWLVESFLDKGKPWLVEKFFYCGKIIALSLFKMNSFNKTNSGVENIKISLPKLGAKT